MKAQVNLLQTVHVRLNDWGYSHWADYINSKKHPMEKLVFARDLKGRADSQGQVEFRMWDFMHIFGSYLKEGVLSPFANNSIIVEL
jgi:hypothetical protein